MRLVIREYLASLRERGELDAVLPDLLTELGFTVYSRPARGTRQYGVDVAAVGTGRDGVRRVHLFSVKSGDLNRAEWNTASPQSLRPSLDEILDHYIASRIPPEYAALPIAICLTFGGAIDEQVRAEVTGYMNRNTTERISYEEWNGDRLADVILDGILREGLLPSVLRSHLRKSVAMVEEPDIALDHFGRLLRALADAPGATSAARLSQARMINICLWIMFVWAREANNVEAPYRASEHAQLEVWHLLKADVARSGKVAEAAGLVINELFELHFAIWDELFETKILPNANVRHALSSAVGSHAALDVNLKLFECVGRLALRGLWLVWQLAPPNGPVVLSEDYLQTLPAVLAGTTMATVERIDGLCAQLMQIISNNRALLSPVGDWQAIDIGLAFTLLACRPAAHGAIDEWAEELAKRSIFAFNVHGRYPVISRSYWDLVDHPSERSEEYRQISTNGSILYPMLAQWAAARGNQKLFDELAAFKAKSLGHCTFQTWLPDEDSEDNLYLGHDNHGAALTGIPVTAGTRDTLDFILEEVAGNPHYDALSAVRLGHWPIVLTACRCHRLPVPPQVWRDLLPATRPLATNAPRPSGDGAC
ncbi:chemotaxis protein [Rhizobium leguminosarum]|uniref:chemotaxis protein n=1 Tax=Rhizobium leguminosarum TaxID=384 RepID=UPI0015DAE6DF|nr:chemotaxis protein [Rhizobium leguminosarum]NZD53140.1 chemotaxis protein [Rhizobium leguminosarum]